MVKVFMVICYLFIINLKSCHWLPKEARGNLVASKLPFSCMNSSLSKSPIPYFLLFNTALPIVLCELCALWTIAGARFCPCEEPCTSYSSVSKLIRKLIPVYRNSLFPVSYFSKKLFRNHSVCFCFVRPWPMMLLFCIGENKTDKIRLLNIGELVLHENAQCKSIRFGGQLVEL